MEVINPFANLAEAYAQLQAQLHKYQEESDLGSIGTMKWLKERTSIKSEDIIKDKILYPFRKELEGRIVHYSEGRGNPWRVNKLRFNQWMDENFERIDWRG